MPRRDAKEHSLEQTCHLVAADLIAIINNSFDIEPRYLHKLQSRRLGKLLIPCALPRCLELGARHGGSRPQCIRHDGGGKD